MKGKIFLIWVGGVTDFCFLWFFELLFALVSSMIRKSLNLFDLSFFRVYETLQDYLGGELRLKSLFNLGIHLLQETSILIMFNFQ